MLSTRKYRTFNNENYEELNNTVLCPGDVVEFTFQGITYPHRVSSHFIGGGGGNNQVMFDLLKLDKIKICTHFYGYIPTSGCGRGGWPEVNNVEDLNKVTKVVIYLFEQIAIQDPASMKPIIKFNTAPLNNIPFLK